MRANNSPLRTGAWALVLFALVLALGAAKPVFAAQSATSTTVSCTTPVTVGSVTVCTVNVTGNSPTGTVDIDAQSGSTGSIEPTTCTLGSGGDCASGVQVEANGVGSVTVVASYSGDANNLASSGTAPLTVNPASPRLSATCADVVVGSDTSCTATLIGAYDPSPSDYITFSQTSGASIVSVSDPECTLADNTCSIPVDTSGAGSVTFEANFDDNPPDPNNAPTAVTGINLTISKTTSQTTVDCQSQTIVVGSQIECSATITGYPNDEPTGTVVWTYSGTAGPFVSTPSSCEASSGSPFDDCSVTFPPITSGLITATYSGDLNNIGSSASIAISANIAEQIQVTVADSGPQTAVTLSGCSVTPTSVQANGQATSFEATSGCSGVELTLPAAGTNTQYLTAAGESSVPVPSCSSSPCQPFSVTIYYQVHNTYTAAPQGTAHWAQSGSIAVTGTSLGASQTNLCAISVEPGSGQYSCHGWSDYGTSAQMGVLFISSSERMATGEGSFTDTSGGNSHVASYYSQVLEQFQYSIIGSSTTPTAPDLSYTTFGASSVTPVTASSSSFWMDSGTSWSVPTTLSGSTSSERWESEVSSGAATGGSTISLTYYDQFNVTFAYAIDGGGTGYTPPAVSFSSFGQPSNGTSSGWVDAGSSYTYTNPLGGSTAVERWLAPQTKGVVSAAGPVTETYYHQYAFELNFTVSGGGAYSNPRLTYSSLGISSLALVNATRSVIWVDAGAQWSVSSALPGSSSTEQWVTTQGTSGTATGSFQGSLLYYNQYLTTIRYSILGSGGNPIAPKLNYTAEATSLVTPLNETARQLWMDAGSNWSVPLSIPGVQGERWVSNVTLPVAVTAGLQVDVQYAHQFYLEASESTHGGGRVADSDQWVNQGGSVVLNATAQSGWSFGYWQGATPFSYNGTSRIEPLAMNGPANETAIFFPGLEIVSGSHGSIQYSYGTTVGTVKAGTNATIYIPPGANVTLDALPDSVSIKFGTWTGALTGSSVQSTVTVSQPGIVSGTFTTDYGDIRTFALATIFIAVAACYVFIINRGFTPKVATLPRRREST